LIPIEILAGPGYRPPDVTDAPAWPFPIAEDAMPISRPLFALLVATLIATIPAHATAPLPSPVAPATPVQSVQAFADAFSMKSVERLGGLLAGDFHFTTTSDEGMQGWLADFDRAHELRFAGNVFHGVTRDGKVVMPAADSVSMTVAELTGSPDPEHPDSTGHYQVVAVHHLTTFIRRSGAMDLAATPALHVFHVVRGDAAVLAAGQPADSTRWYVRRWVEDLDALTAALDKLQGDCGQADSTLTRVRGALAPTLPLAIHPLGNPACPTLDIACDLPAAGSARIEVFDVMGRRMAQKDFEVAKPGTMKLQAAGAVHLSPGAYWVRLTQAASHSTRMVVVAR
jgi:hypothetical protein